MLAFAGIGYLAWLGITAIRHSFHAGEKAPRQLPARAKRHAFRDGILIAIGNPKSLIYMLAIIPPFVDAASPLVHKIAMLALVALALAIDLPIGALYIGAGQGWLDTRVMERAATQRWIDRAIGALFPDNRRNRVRLVAGSGL